MHAFLKNIEYFTDVDGTIDEVSTEIEEGLDVLNRIEAPIVSFFGSHIIPEDDPVYQHCRRTANILAQDGFAVLTGGGPGFMEAANEGAKQAGMPSIGIKESLLMGEQISKEVHTHIIECEFMFVRRFLLGIKSSALVVYPGGYGTFNEMFEYVVLMQTNILDRVPVIFVGTQFWKGLREWLRDTVSEEKMIAKKDLDLIHYVDTSEEVLEIIRKSEMQAE